MTQIYHLVQQRGTQQIRITGAGEHACLFLIDGGSIDVQIDVDCEAAQLRMACVLVSAYDRPSGVNIAVRLNASGVTADVYALSLLGEGAKATVTGGITLSEHAVKSEGYLAEENLVLGDHVSIKTLPMLDVRTNDVKASHGATIDRLDEQKLFYMTAKGIARHDAIRLLTDAYITKTCEHVGVSTSTL